MKLDENDQKIIDALMADGRASLREVARRTSLTAPTVSARLARMMKSGMVKRFAPVINPESLDGSILAILTLKVAPGASEALASGLLPLREVEGVYATTGDSNMTLKVRLGSVRDLQSFVKAHLMPGKAAVTANQIVTETLKDEPPSLSSSSLSMKLTCEYCGGEISSERPYNIVSGPLRYYFCCRTCRKEYLEEHGPRLSKLGVLSSQE
jgi:DNA-binding Lrp family transcriptional regulator